MPPRKRTSGGLAILAIFTFAVLVGLGTWQLQRLFWKQDLIAHREARFALAPLRILNPFSTQPEAFRRVLVEGRFLHDKEILVGPRSFRGRPGWHVITPMEYVSGGILLIDRGWVPLDQVDGSRRHSGHNTSVHSIVGIANRSRNLGYFEPPNLPEKNQWFRVEPKRMAKKLMLQGVAPYWVVADNSPNLGGFPIGRNRIRLLANNHLQYVLTWYGMALSLIVLSVVYRRQGRG